MAKQPKAIFGNHPFTPDGKKDEPIFLDSSNIGYFVYPDEGLDYSDLNNVFFSGEHLTVCTMDIGPGGFFNPPDYHPGDEAYFITEGVDSQYCPATGQMIQVGKDACLRPCRVRRGPSVPPWNACPCRAHRKKAGHEQCARLAPNASTVPFLRPNPRNQ